MTSRARIATGIVLAAVALAGGVGMGPAVADPAGTTLRYQCSMPLFPSQPMTVRLTWNAPKSVASGRKTPIVPFRAVATMGAVVTQGLNAIRAATVEGSANATGVVAAPEGGTEVDLPLTVSRTKVPASGPITVVASGTTPELVFHRPGHATITVGREFAVRLIPKNADGGSTMIGQVDASCTLEPGQDIVLTSFEITAAGGNPAQTSGGSTRPTAAGGGSPASGTRGTVAGGPRGSVAAQVPGAGPGSRVLPTVDTGTAATHGTAFATVSTAGLAAAVAPWLVGGVILVVGVVLGCVWLLRRRHRHGGRGQSDSL